jgi:hypothetical protein
MAKRAGYGGIAALGDLVAALAGRAFGSGTALTYAISPAKTAVDASQGSDFTLKMAATSVVKIGNPTNYDDGTELVFHIQGITTFGTIVWDTLYQTTGAFATFSTAKVKSIGFRYVAGLGKFTELFRTTSK